MWVKFRADMPVITLMLVENFKNLAIRGTLSKFLTTDTPESCM
jgi:hypothetical protein